MRRLRTRVEELLFKSAHGIANTLLDLATDDGGNRAFENAASTKAWCAPPSPRQHIRHEV